MQLAASGIIFFRTAFLGVTVFLENTADFGLDSDSALSVFFLITFFGVTHFLPPLPIQSVGRVVVMVVLVLVQGPDCLLDWERFCRINRRKIHCDGRVSATSCSLTVGLTFTVGVICFRRDGAVRLLL